MRRDKSGRKNGAKRRRDGSRAEPAPTTLCPTSNPTHPAPPSTRGFNIGARLVDDYLARTRTPRCPDLRAAADAVARGAFKQYLGAAATVAPPPPGAGPGAPVRAPSWAKGGGGRRPGGVARADAAPPRPNPNPNPNPNPTPSRCPSSSTTRR
jgi:hypothetical protein